MSNSLFDLKRFGVGQSVTRKEDGDLLTGKGRFADDVSTKGQVYLAFVHSPVAHGRIRSIDTQAAREAEGVLGVWTGADMKAAGYRMPKCMLALPNRDGSPLRETERYPLAVDRVRFAGECVACVAAETLAQARDAAEAVVLDIEALPAVTDVEAAIAEGAPQLFDHIPNNIVVDYQEGDAAAVDAAFARAAHVVRLTLDDPRIVINPMELRSCLALYDAASDRFTIHTQSQGVFPLHKEIAGCLGVPSDKITVKSGNVGGSFGMRIVSFPEQICALHAARLLRRPVKWTEERTTSFLTDYHGRANRYTAELATDKKGLFLGLRVRGFGNLGGYLNPNGLSSPAKSVFNNINSMYRLPCLTLEVKCVLTNTSLVGAYRGAGRQAANYMMERLIDETSRVSGIDRVELRRRNQIRPDELPYKALSGLTYDSGDFTAMMDEALEAADFAGFAKRRAESKRRGCLRGLGIGCFLEVTSVVTRELGGIRFEANGDVTFITGTFDYGQGHASTFAQILGQKLGVPFERIKLLQGDSDEIRPWGGYTGGSRSVIVSGTAALQAADLVIGKALQLAGWALQTSANDIEFKDGSVVVASSGKSIDLIELARRVREARDLPSGLPTSLDSRLVAEDGAGPTFPNGCHVAEVEIEEATGIVRVVRYVMTNDIGVVVNPMLLDGQCHGGVVQGIGQALMESAVYDEHGQFVSGSFTDYCMPRAEDVPSMVTRSRPTRTETNVLGAKGVGESGCAGSLGSVMNAIVDALSTVGINEIDMPATPEKVWRMIRDARQAMSA